MKRKRFRRKLKNFILKSLACIAVINFILFALLIDYLTFDGWILALVVNGIGGVYLWLLAYANGCITGTEHWYEREVNEEWQ